MKLETARTIVEAAQRLARAEAMKPLVIAVLDARGALKAMIAEDGTSLHRADVAIGKAYGGIALGQGSRRIMDRALKDPHFIAAVSHVVGGKLVPVPGGVLIRDPAGELVGAVGISGDTSENDEKAACAGIVAAGLVADTGV